MQVAQLRRDKSALEAKVESHAAERAELVRAHAAEIAALNERLEHLRGVEEALEAERAAKVASEAAHRNERSSLRARFLNSAAESHDLQKQLTSAQNQVSRLSEDLRHQVNVARGSPSRRELTRLQERASRAQERATRAEAEISTYRSQAMDEAEEAARLSQRLRTAEREINDLQRDNADLQTQLANATQENSKLRRNSGKTKSWLFGR